MMSLFSSTVAGSRLEGIMITIGTIHLLPVQMGLAAFYLAEGNYTQLKSVVTFLHFSVPETTYVDADICSEVTFHVTNEQGYPLENVLIDVDGSNYLITDFNGEADTCLQVGSYTLL